MKNIMQIKKTIIRHVSVMFAAFSLFAGCNTKISDPVSKTESQLMDGIPPVTVMNNLSGGQYVQGGSTQSILFTVTDALGFDANMVEYSRDNGTSWILATSASGASALYYPSLSGEVAAFDWLVPQEPDCAAAAKTSDSDQYLIRITSTGRPDAVSATVQSAAVFTVDSCAPILATSGFTNLEIYNHGFAKVQLSNISDIFSLSPISEICVKLTTTTPTATDACWTRVEAFSITASANITSIPIPYFLGYIADTFTLSVWGRDAAGNTTTLISTAATDTLSIAYACNLGPGASNNCTHLAYATLACYSDTNTFAALAKTDEPANPVAPNNGNRKVLDPGLFVVTSDGVIYARDKVAGIVKLDLLANTSSTLIGVNAASVDGNIDVAKVKQAMRLALDSKENLIIYDYDRIRRVNLHASTPNVETLVGGGASPDTVSDTLTDATNLGITYHDNLIWYATFAVLPNDYIVFNSEDPNAALGAAGMRLRIYQPDQTNKIVSVRFTGTGVYGNSSQAITGLYPYGAMGVKYDKTTEAITNYYARLCDSGTTCNPQTAALFNGTAVATMGSPETPSSWSNGAYIISRSGDLWAANAYAGEVRKLNTLTNTWELMLGAGQGTGCADGTLATSFACTINLWDAYIAANDVLYFIDAGKVRFVDSLGRVRTVVQ